MRNVEEFSDTDESGDEYGQDMSGKIDRVEITSSKEIQIGNNIFILSHTEGGVLDVIKQLESSSSDNSTINNLIFRRPRSTPSPIGSDAVVESSEETDSTNEIVADGCNPNSKNLKLNMPAPIDIAVASPGMLLTPSHFRMPSDQKERYQTPYSNESVISSARRKNSSDAIFKPVNQLKPNKNPAYLFSVNSDEVRREDSIQLQRVQSMTVQHGWQLLPNSYIENLGYRLGVRECKHFQNDNGVIVEVQNGKNFELIVGNILKKRCNVDISVNGKVVAKLQLHAEQNEFVLRGPITSIKSISRKFVFLRSRDAPKEANIDIYCPENGVIEAKFTPEIENKQMDVFRSLEQMIKDGISSHVDEVKEVENIQYAVNKFHPTAEIAENDENYGLRSAMLDSWCGGAVALQGTTEKNNYHMAHDMKVDPKKSVILKLRMVARKDDETKHNPTEEITPLYEMDSHPPLPI